MVVVHKLKYINMSFEYKIRFKDGKKKQILNEIYESLKNDSNFMSIENNLDSICIKSNIPNSKWENLADIEIVDDGYFFTTTLNRNERNFIIDEITEKLKAHSIDIDIEEV